MWNEIITSQDIECFLNQIDYFADSCIKEMRYVTGSYAQGRSLHAVDDRRDLCILFHSISNYLDPINPHVSKNGKLNADYNSFEIKFSYVHKLMLEHSADCDSVIYDTTLVKKDGLFYWYDYKEDNIPNFTPNGTMVAAEKMSWRFIF